MVYGHNIARCLHCGKEWVVGDCDPFTCHECETAGHIDWPNPCPVCQAEYERVRMRIEQAKARAQSGAAH